MEGVVNRVSFAALGQATAFCSRSPNSNGVKKVYFEFNCAPSYKLTSLIDSGLLYFSSGTKHSDLLVDTTCY